MQITDLVSIGTLGNKLDENKYIKFKKNINFQSNIFERIKDFFLLFKDHRVRYVTVLDIKTNMLKFDDDEIAEDAAASSGVKLALPRDELDLEKSSEISYLNWKIQFKEQIIGRIIDVFNNSFYSIFVVKTTDNNELLIPDVENFIMEKNSDKTTIIVKNIKILLEL